MEKGQCRTRQFIHRCTATLTDLGCIQAFGIKQPLALTTRSPAAHTPHHVAFTFFHFPLDCSTYSIGTLCVLRTVLNAWRAINVNSWEMSRERERRDYVRTSEIVHPPHHLDLCGIRNISVRTELPVCLSWAHCVAVQMYNPDVRK